MGQLRMFHCEVVRIPGVGSNEADRRKKGMMPDDQANRYCVENNKVFRWAQSNVNISRTQLPDGRTGKTYIFQITAEFDDPPAPVESAPVPKTLASIPVAALPPALTALSDLPITDGDLGEFAPDA